MTLEKQVSPVIRISRGERDASARATHLEAATRKFLVTTNERKQMSTKTNFKRIALVAVAALGMGVLSSTPSQAVVALTNITLTGVNGTATIAQSDSRTGATIALTFLGTANTDTMVVTVAAKTKPTAADAYPVGYLSVSDTSTSVGAGLVIGMGATSIARSGVDHVIVDSVNASARATTNSAANESFTSVKQVSGNNTWNSLNLRLHMAPATTRVAGTYVYTITATPDRATGGLQTADAKSIDVSIVIAAADLTASPVYSTAVMSSAATTWAAPIPNSDSSVSVSNTASGTSKAVIRVSLRDADNAFATAAESITATTTVGTFGTGSTSSIGRSIVLQYNATDISNGYKDIWLFADGTSGTAAITISTPSVTFAAKSATFYSTTVATLVAVAGTNTINVGANTSSATNTNYAPIWGLAKDAAGATVRLNAAGSAAVYAYSSDLTVISDSGTACTFQSATGYAMCPLTGLKAGTANITLRNLGTDVTSGAIISNAIAITVSDALPATVKMAWDKATYAPGERAFLKIWALDAAGKPVSNKTIVALLATGGVTSTSSFSNSTSLPTVTDYQLQSAVKALSPTTLVDSLDPVYIHVVNMPVSGSSVTVTATGGSGVASAGRVAVTATAAITDNGAAALAAVTALATTVASLRTLITTLTNLVLKIQKKVKA